MHCRKAVHLVKILLADFLCGILDTLDDVVEVGLCKSGMMRSIELSSVEEILSIGAKVLAVAELLEAGELVCGLIVKNTLNALFLVKNAHEIVAACAELFLFNADCVQMVDVLAVGILINRCNTLDALDAFTDVTAVLDTLCIEHFKLFELMNTDSALALCHTEVVTPLAVDHSVVEVAGKPVICLILPVYVVHAADLVDSFSINIAVAGDHTAFTESCDILERMEAEAAEVTDRTGLSALVFSTGCMSAVLKNDEVVLLCDLHDGIHIAHLSTIMYDENSLCLVCNLFLDL